jgi:hypothetical protein
MVVQTMGDVNHAAMDTDQRTVNHDAKQRTIGGLLAPFASSSPRYSSIFADGLSVSPSEGSTSREAVRVKGICRRQGQRMRDIRPICRIKRLS